MPHCYGKNLHATWDHTVVYQNGVPARKRSPNHSTNCRNMCSTKTNVVGATHDDTTTAPSGNSCLDLSLVDFAYGTERLGATQVVPPVLIISPQVHARLSIVQECGLARSPIDVGHGRLLRFHSPDKLGLGRRVHTLSGSPEARSMSRWQKASIQRFL